MSRYRRRSEFEADHRFASELLPWFVTGRLEPEEQKRIASHLGECEVCREEVDSCREMAAHLPPLEAVAPAPHPAQLGRLLSRLDRGPSEDDESAAARAHSPFAWWRALAGARFGWILGTQALLVLVVAGSLWLTRRGPAPAYRTLSTSPAVSRPAGPEVRVIFRPGASETEVRAVLLTTGTQIVGGPSPLGAYRLAIRELDSPPDPVDDIVALLRAHPAVQFAEPVAGRVGDER